MPPPAIGIAGKIATVEAGPLGRRCDGRDGVGVNGAFASSMHDRFGDHAVNALGAVHGLGHPQIGCETAERVGIFARQIALFAEQHDHVAQRPPCGRGLDRCDFASNSNGWRRDDDTDLTPGDNLIESK